MNFHTAIPQHRSSANQWGIEPLVMNVEHVTDGSGQQGRPYGMTLDEGFITIVECETL